METKSPITVYYNSACPVCDAGIGYQKDQLAACSVQWIDVHEKPDAANQLGTELEFVRERLHVRNAQGQIKVGSAALAELWLQTPRQAWLGRLLNLPGFKQMSAAAYNVFARCLYRWNRWRKHW